MKKTCFTLLLLFFLGQSYAQVAQWLIPPVYDSIYFAKGANLFVTDSANFKVFWDHNGHRLFATSETIHPFSSDCAVMTNDTNSVLGFYDIRGNLTTFNSRKVKVANDYPYFSDNYLIVKKNRYYIIDSEGGIDKTKHLRVYPFRNGYAVCHDYEKPEKQKGTVRFLMDKNKTAVPLVYDGKTYKASDVDFISSVNDEQLAIVVIKKSLFFLDMKERKMSPIVFPNSNSGKRPVQAELEGDLPLSSDESAPIIHAHCKKGERVTIYFNKQLVPTDIYYNSEETHFKQNVNTPEKPSTPLSASYKNNLFGLMCDGKMIIPAQFDAIGRCFGSQAFAKFSGKHGLLQANDKDKLNFSINNGNELGFRHQTLEAVVRVDMPSTLDPSKIDFVVAPDAGYSIDRISKQTKETDSGNRAEFTCSFTIPSTIKEKTADFSYPFQISYDNIMLLPFQQTVKMWRDNYYDVTIDDTEMEYDKKSGLFSFPYTISMMRNANEETSHFELKVLLDNLEVDIEKLSTMRGICSIPASDLEDGENYISFELTEQGCPPLTFPYSINFKKPKGKKAPVKKDFKIEALTPQVE